MLVSLNKNPWLLEWMKDNWREEVLVIFRNPFLLTLPNEVRTPKQMRKNIAELLSKNGYKAKTVKGGEDVIVAIPDEEFVFIKIKYL